MNRTPVVARVAKVLGLTLASLSFLSACDTAPPPPPVVKANVKVFEVAMKQVTPSREFVGRTESTQDITIKSKVRGNLLKTNFEEGSVVEEGALLFEIDPAQYDAAVKASEALVAQAKAAYDTAVLNFKRGEGLIKDNFISQSDYDNLLSRKLQTAASLQSANAELDNAKLELGYTKIYAPFTGRISRAAVFTGDLISPDQTKLADLVQMEPVWVNFQLPEKVLIEAQRAHKSVTTPFKLNEFPVKIKFPDGTLFDEIGKMDFVDNRVDATTGTLAIRAEFPNKEHIIVPGLYVTVIIESPEQQEVMLIPQRAVQEDQQGRYVLTVDKKDIVTRRNVELGERYGIDWQVEKGLEKGDLVITEGLQKARIGAEVDHEMDTIQPFSDTQS
ncbi:efflux RND transporter periplasmic adaptor subunit [Agarivorans litoreus]|uniref:efflux RND transporter periplasmic adaptor subunit n=1 Tax=Agarivorans litoreus TaxID=1510455 RepID=UPI001C7DADD3|nr:efflux RND transporter periplasmic adaptor subunit [Agarivorans litoreus]